MATATATRSEVAELRAAIKAEREAREELGRRVIQVGRAAKSEYHWCGVADETFLNMGLSPFLPPVYEVQRKGHSGGRWGAQRTGFDTVEEAQRYAESSRERYRGRQRASADLSYYVGTTLTPTTDIKALIAEVKAQHKALVARAAAEAARPAPVYPAFRVVARKGPHGRAVEVKA